MPEDRLASFAQPDGHAPVWGGNSFAEFSMLADDVGHTVGQQMGLRVPALPGADPVLSSGLWLSVADQDIASALLSESAEEGDVRIAVGRRAA